jgi:Ca-activated chloride channel family protein
VSFIWPWALGLLLVIPLLAGLYAWMQTRRRKYALRYASVSLVREAVGPGPGVRRHIPAVLYLTAVAAMVFALARPEATLSLPQSRGIVILAIDVSGSMLATDVQPDRMEATKRAVRQFVEKQPRGVQIGVVAFSDFGALVQAPTRERKPVLDAINRLRPQRGTNMGGGLAAALDAIYALSDANLPTPVRQPSARSVPPAGSDTPPASVILLSDGQSNTGPPVQRIAEEAAANGIRVYTVGIGTPEGTILQISGRSVFTRLDEEALRQVADITDGRYLSAQDERELEAVYDELARERTFEEEKTEVTFAFAGAAMLLSVIGGALSLLWFNRLP